MKKQTVLLSIGLLVAILTFQSCRHMRCIDGYGEVIKAKRDVGAFNSIILKGSANVFIKQGTRQSVVVESNDDLQSLIETAVNGTTLYLTTKKSICPTALNIFIVAEELNEVAIRGSGDIRTDGQIKTDEMRISVNGSGDIKMDVDAKMLMVEINGSGDVTLKGQADATNTTINGSGDVDAFGLKARDANVSIYGSGDVKVNAADELEVHISGSGDVEYSDIPGKIHTYIKGSGSLRKR